MTKTSGWVIALVAGGGLYLMASGLFVFGAVHIFGPKDYAPLHNINPQIVQEDSVPQGGTLHVTGTKCVNGDTATSVESSSSWQNQDDRTIRVLYLATRDAVRQPGCITRTFENRVPIDLPPGRYVLEAVEIARKGDQIQQEPWFTESFEVTPHD